MFHPITKLMDPSAFDWTTFQAQLELNFVSFSALIMGKTLRARIIDLLSPFSEAVLYSDALQLVSDAFSGKRKTSLRLQL